MFEPVDHSAFYEAIAAQTAELPNPRAWKKIGALLRAHGWHYIGFPRKKIWEARKRLLADPKVRARARAASGENVV